MNTKPRDTEKGAGEDGKSTVRSVERAVGLMRAVAESGRDGCRFVDLCSSSGLSKSTTHRMLAALIDAGMIEQDPEGKLYFAGVGMFLLGTASAARYSIVEIARPSLIRLAQETGDTTFLTLPIGDDWVCAERQLGPFPIRTLTVDVGDSAPLGLGSGGLALLASLDDARVDAVVEANRARLAGYRHFDPPGMRRLIAATRRLGFSFVDGLMVEGMSAIGVPIRATDGRPLGALSVAAITSRLAAGRRRTVFAKIQQEVRRIEQQLAVLGGVRPVNNSEQDHHERRSA